MTDDFIIRRLPEADDPAPAAISDMANTAEIGVAVPLIGGTTSHQAPLDNGMLRYNSGKIPLSLLPASYTYYAGMGLAYGAIKYNAHNWRRGGSWTKAYESMQRHMDAWREGEDIDAESGLPHLALAGCNLAFLTEFFDKKIGVDDRFRYPDQGADARRPGRTLTFNQPEKQS